MVKKSNNAHMCANNNFEHVKAGFLFLFSIVFKFLERKIIKKYLHIMLHVGFMFLQLYFKYT